MTREGVEKLIAAQIKHPEDRISLIGMDFDSLDLRQLDLRQLILRGANLRFATCRDSNLSGVSLQGANLYNIDFTNADLRGANLYGANLYGACLARANMTGANLEGANLFAADLRNTLLEGANLKGANLCEAIILSDFTDTKGLSSTNLANIHMKNGSCLSAVPMACPEEGSFTAFKIANGHIVVLKVPADAKRCSATGRKCRCDKAKVVAIENLDGTISNLKRIPSNFSSNFVYTVGKIVKVVDFDEIRWNECSTGIHFFMSREEARRYANPYL